ncbi:MAG: hypothetical protein PHI85_04035 [Victivallaceae bacterium]|nr:hypothetical protein [Victivallaceae bacterium]
MPPKLPRRVVGAIDRLRADTWNRLLDCVEYAMCHPRADGKTTRLTEAGELAVMRPANAAAGAAASVPAAAGYAGPSAVSFDKATGTVYIAAGYALYHYNCLELPACSFVYSEGTVSFTVKLYLTLNPDRVTLNVTAGYGNVGAPDGANYLNCENVDLAVIDTFNDTVTQLRYGAIDVRWRT